MRMLGGVWLARGSRGIERITGPLGPDAGTVPKLNPRRSVAALRRPQRERLQTTMREVIRESNRHGLIPRRRGWLTEQRGRPDAYCPRCGRRFRRETVAGRTAYWCTRCQRG
jgi:formamidopyrimidine-DNA glycosylase